MATVEINSFIGKFLNLWKSGLDASLTLESHAGEASVSLRLGLGTYCATVPEVVDKPCFTKKVSPSQVRRRQQRAKARHDAAKDKGITNVNETSAEDVELTVSIQDTTEMETSEEDAATSDATEKVDIDEKDLEIETNRCELEEDDDLLTQLEELIMQSRRNRSLWEKCSSVPP